MSHEQLKAENDRLRKTLAVFADPENWHSQFLPHIDPSNDEIWCMWHRDEIPYEFARLALEGK